MLDKREITSSIIGTVGITTSVQNLTEILNLIVLILSIVNIMWVLVYGIYKHVKHKEYDKISEDLEKAKNGIENVKKEDNKNG